MILEHVTQMVDVLKKFIGIHIKIQQLTWQQP